MSKRRRNNRNRSVSRQVRLPVTTPPAVPQQIRGALALADTGSNPANVTRLWTPAAMAGTGYSNDPRADQQWGTQTSSGQTPSDKYFPDMPTVPDDKPLLTNIGATGTAIFSGVVTNEEYNPDFYWRDGIKIYEQMLRNDAQVNAVREIVEQPILRADRHIVPGSKDARDQEIASFVETCLFEDLRYTSVDGIDEVQTFDELLRHILMHLWYGFMVFEQVWRIEDGWVKWARWTPLLPRTIWRWWVGNDNSLTGIQQWTFRDHNYQFVDIPAKKLVRFHRRLEGQNYEGVSALRSAYKHWFYKVQFEKIEAIAAERNAVTPAVISLPEGFTNNDYLNAQTIVANIRANQSMGVTLPPGWGIEYMRNFQHSAAALQPSIQYHDVMIARNMLAQFINLGSTETGAYSLDDSQRKDFLNNLQSICCSIEDTINLGPIKQLVDYNFDGVEVYPKLQFGKVLMSDMTAVADALSKLATAGFIHQDPEMEDFLREAFGLPGAPQSVIEAYNPTAPTTPSRPDNANANSHDTQQPQQANQRQGGSASGNTGPDDAGGSAGSDGGGDSGGGALSEVRLLADALQATVRAIDPTERGMLYLGGHPPGYNAQGHGPHGHWLPGEGGEHEHEGSGSGRGRGGAGSGEGELSQTSKGEHEATAKSSGGARSGGSGSKSAKAPKEDMHAKSARLQKEGGLKAEVHPSKGKELEVVKKTGWKPIDPFHAPSPHDLVTTYGEHQLGAALHQFSHESLREMARNEGVKTGRTRDETISRITSHVTEGRYSANFVHTTSTAKAPKEPSATKTTRAPRAPRATQAAKSSGERTLEQHTHDELKAMAKEQGVKAGKTKAETIANLRAPHKPTSSVFEHPAEHAAYHAAMARAASKESDREHHERMAAHYAQKAEEKQAEDTARASRLSKAMANSKQRELINQAYRDWSSGRAHIDRQGKNYKLYTVDAEGYATGRSRSSAPWNKLIQSTHTQDEFFKRADEYAKAHPGEIHRVKHPIGGLSEPGDINVFTLMEQS